MWCTTQCWECEDRKCEHYISKTELYFENQRLKDKLQQKENKEKEIRKYIEKHVENIDRGQYYEDYVETYPILEILDKGVDKE